MLFLCSIADQNFRVHDLLFMRRWAGRVWLSFVTLFACLLCLLVLFLSLFCSVCFVIFVKFLFRSLLFCFALAREDFRALGLFVVVLFWLVFVCLFACMLGLFVFAVLAFSSLFSVSFFWFDSFSFCHSGSLVGC